MMPAMPAAARPVLTSRSNPRVAAVVALRDRRERVRQGLTLVDGAREVRRAIEAGAGVVDAFVCEPLLAGPDARAALDAIDRAGVPMTTVNEAVFERLAFGDRGEGLVLVVRIPDLGLHRLTVPPRALVAIIEGVEKPGNVGALLRSADGAGADAVVAASPRTDLFNPNAIRASAGTIFGLPLGSAPSAEVLAWATEVGLRIITTRVDADDAYTDVDLTGPVAIVLGAEADGLSDVWSGPGMRPVRIPMAGVADSLNVSVSAALLLYEAQRQRQRHGGGAD